MNDKSKPIYSNLGIAEIFLWISIILSAFFAIFFSIMLTLSYYGVRSRFETEAVLILGIIGFFFVGATIETLVIVRKMREAIMNNDIVTLKALNSKSISIIALFLGGIIPGIILLYLHKRINALEETDSRIDSVEKIEGLLQMYKEELISKDEFLERKNAILGNIDPVQLNIANLRQIKELFGKGEISQDEYDELRKKVLSKY